MDKIEHVFQTSVEQLVREIVAVNHAWKAARELFGDDSPVSTSTRDLKTCLQMRLPREHAPDQVYLVKDSAASNELGEEIYSLQLRNKVGDRLYAFAQGSTELKPEGKDFLRRFIPVYSRVIFSKPEIENEISRVVIEGHTSSEGDDKTNMELSVKNFKMVTTK